MNITIWLNYQCARSIEIKFSCDTTPKFYGSERIIVFRREMSWRTRGETSSFDRLHWISNALKDLSGVVRESDTKSDEDRGEGSKMASTYYPVSSAMWPRELRNQMASRTLRVLEHPAGAHCDFHLPAKPSPSPCNCVTYSNPSDPPAFSRILSSIRGVLFPPIIVFPFIAINVNRGTLVYVDIFTIVDMERAEL